MEYRNLGKSGLKVSLFSFGSWLTFGKQIKDNTAEDLMKTAYDAGINFFDNAEIYSRGQSEIVMGEVLKKMGWARDTFILSSKAFFGAGGKLPTQTGLNRKHLVEACDAALSRLQVDYLDLFFCHRPDKETPIEETVWTMHNLIQQGKILYWGTSEWSAQEIMEAHMVARQYNLIGPTMEQPQYNMFWRDKLEVEYSQIFKTVGLGTTIWSPLMSGLLSGKYNDGYPEDTRLNIEGLEWLKDRTLAEEKIEKTRQMTKMAKDLGMSMAQLALIWCTKNQNVSTVILGASKTTQLEENLKALDMLHKLDEGVMEKIEEILQNKPEAPPILIKSISLFVLILASGFVYSQETTYGTNSKEKNFRNSGLGALAIIPFADKMYMSDADAPIGKETGLNPGEIMGKFRNSLVYAMEDEMKKDWNLTSSYGNSIKEANFDLDFVHASVKYKYDPVGDEVLMLNDTTIRKRDLKKKKSQGNDRNGIYEGQVVTRSQQGERFMNAYMIEDSLTDFLNHQLHSDYYLFLTEFDIRHYITDPNNMGGGGYKYQLKAHFTCFDKEGQVLTAGAVTALTDAALSNVYEIIKEGMPELSEKLAKILRSKHLDKP